MRRNVWSVEELARVIELAEEAAQGDTESDDVLTPAQQAYQRGYTNALSAFRRGVGAPPRDDRSRR